MHMQGIWLFADDRNPPTASKKSGVANPYKPGPWPQRRAFRPSSETIRRNTNPIFSL